MADRTTAIERLLNEVRVALRTGAYDRLETLAKRQSELVGSLAEDPPPELAEVERLRRAATENRRLIEAALAGIRAARPAPGGDGAISTYDRNGRRQALDPVASRRELRRETRSA